jgi:hypothetical protein
MSATVKEKDDDTNLLILAVEFHSKRPKTCISLFVGVIILLILVIVMIVIAISISVNENSQNCEGNANEPNNAIHKTDFVEPKYELLSRSMPTKQSNRGWESYYANDGIYDPSKPCYQSALENHPWWMVDLLKTYHIGYVNVYNRGDGEHNGPRLQTVIVETSKNGVHFNKTGELKENAVLGSVHLIEINSVGRYVRLKLTKTEPEMLSVCEVDVYGYVT